MADNSQENRKMLPQSEEAEKSVLGGLLIDEDAMVKVADILSIDDFYQPKHRKIYKACLNLFENDSPVDTITLTDKLKDSKDLDSVGGASYLAELANFSGTSAHIRRHAKIVNDKATLRRLISASSTISELALNPSMEAEEIIDKAEGQIFNLSKESTTNKFTPIEDILEDSFERIDSLHKDKNALRGIPTHFKDLDNMISGLQSSDLIILAGRPSMGKSTLALNIGVRAAIEEKMPVGVFSLEMSKEQLVDRLICEEAKVDSWKLRTGNLNDDDFVKIGQAMGTLSEAPIFLEDTPALSVMEIRAKARRLQAEHDIKLVIVDYLQLIEGSGSSDNRVQQMSDISRSLKALARELDVPVIALSQLSRAVESRDPQIPRLSDLRESGCLTGDTIITDANTGKQYQIKKLAKTKQKIKVWSMDNQYKLKKITIKKAFYSGEKKVFRLKLASGKEVRASANHPFYTIKGWKRLDDLKEGVKLATPRILSSSSNMKIDNNKLRVLAHMIGGGCYLSRQPIHYTNQDPESISLVRKSAKKAFGVKTRIVEQDNCYYLYLSSSKKLARNIRNPIAEWFDRIGIFNQRSKNKVIPEIVFNLSNDQLGVFIRHLWSTDGTISRYKPKNDRSPVWSINYTSSSIILIHQLQHLLLRFGIISTIRKKQNHKKQVWYNLCIQSSQEQQKFISKIGIFGSKSKKIKKAKKELVKINKNVNLDTIPRYIWKKIDRVRLAFNETARLFHAKLNWAYSGTARTKHDISRNNLEYIISVFENEELENLARSDLYWDEIKSIEYIGEKSVYDIEVPKFHNFVANDIIVHNSIEQDADLVLMLYREDYYNPETENKNITDIIIGKHRNGPTGQIQLYFSKDQLAFKDLDVKHASSQSQPQDKDLEL